MSRRAIVVADLGYGDCGKGTVTDHFVRSIGADLVVRFNGGAQAGHTVVLPDGRAHTFSQFGAGSFVAGVRTHLSRYMVVHPGGLLEEAERLESKGVSGLLERLTISAQALVITPFQQAANRLREVLRGSARHGSCGLGIGETMQDDLEFPGETVRAADLRQPEILRRKLARWQQRKWETFRSHRRHLLADSQGALEWQLLESPDVIERWIAQAQRLAGQVSDLADSAHLTGSVVFEGAQGVLLDEWRGFHPHTTWSTCTFDNALQILDGWDAEVMRVGVLRSYATRHGAGPFPTEDVGLCLPEPHNVLGPWQGGFRQGWLDLVTARYAIDCCQGVDGLALTHLDRVAPGWKVATSYHGVPAPYYQHGKLTPGPWTDLGYQERMARALGEAEPRYESVTSAGLVAKVEECLEARVLLESWGPCPEHKKTPAAVL